MIVVSILQLLARLEAIQPAGDGLFGVVLVGRPHVAEEVVVVGDQGRGVFLGGGGVVQHRDGSFDGAHLFGLLGVGRVCDRGERGFGFADDVTHVRIEIFLFEGEGSGKRLCCMSSLRGRRLADIMKRNQLNDDLVTLLRMVKWPVQWAICWNERSEMGRQIPLIFSIHLTSPVAVNRNYSKGKIHG
jgi:hypothetical protein